MLKRSTQCLQFLYKLFLIGCIGMTACSAPTPELTLTTTSTISPPTATMEVLDGKGTETMSITSTPIETMTSTVTAVPTRQSISTVTATLVAKAPPVSKERISGIEIYPKQENAELPIVDQAGVAWIRVNAILWSDVEPFENRRDWKTIQYLEDLMLSASAQGLQTVMIVRSTPQWARKNPNDGYCGPIAEDKFENFADFMIDVVDRYSVPPFNVKYWEIWNEPDVDPSLVKSTSIYGCWGNLTDPYNGGQYFGGLLKAIYPKIKNAQPDIKVVVGGLLLDCDPINPPESPLGSGKLKDCSSSRFLDGVLESGAGNAFDAVSFHAYDYYGEKEGAYGNLNWNSTWNTTGPLLIRKVEYLRNLLAQYGFEKELLNTENALICGSSQAKCTSDEFAATKAYYAAQSLAAGRMMGLKANIWYSTTGWRSSGLVDSTYNLLPVFESYRFSIRELDEAIFNRVIDDYPGLTGYEFERNGTKVWLIWSPENKDGMIRLSEPPDAVYDVFGTAILPDRDLHVSLGPIYLEWAP